MDLRKVKKLIELVEESGIQELEVSSGDESVRITMPGGPSGPGGPGAGVPVPNAVPQVVGQPAPAAVVSADSQSAGATVHAPMAGTFYRAPHPEAAAFVEVGQSVSVGDVVCIIESMKMMHEIRAEVAGTVSQIIVDNAQPVNTGDVLFRLS